MSVCLCWLVLLCGVRSAVPPAPRAASAHLPIVPEPGSAFARQAAGTLPLRFEPNLGQYDPQVRFVAHGPGYTLFLTTTAAVFVYNVVVGRTRTALVSRVVWFALTGAWVGARLIPEGQLHGLSNYFLGSDPHKWYVGVSGYARVVEHDALPGVDMVYDSDGGKLSVRLIVEPGVDPERLRFVERVDASVVGLHGTDRSVMAMMARVQGSSRVSSQRSSVDSDTPMTVMRWGQPIASQREKGTIQVVPVRSVTTGRGQFGFAVGLYDHLRTLLISSSIAVDAAQGAVSSVGHGIAVDRAGRIYVVGSTNAADFPITPRAAQRTLISNDAYVAAFAPGGRTLLYSTYIGGRLDTIGLDITVDTAGSAYITGFVDTNDLQHVDFPTTRRAFSHTRGAVFVTKLSMDGGRLVYSTLLGDDSDAAYGLAVDATGCAYVTGRANVVFGAAKPHFPTTPHAFQRTPDAQGNAFVTKLSSDGSHLIYSTLLGSQEVIGVDIAIDGAGHAYVTGNAVSTDGHNFPMTPGAFGRRGNIFVSELAPDGGSLVYSGLLGGVSYSRDNARGRDEPNDPGGIAVDRAGNAYVTGSTVASDFPTTSGAFFSQNGGVFVVKIAPGGRRLVYSARVGGSADMPSDYNVLSEYDDRGHAIAVDAQGQAYVTGDARTADFPTSFNAGTATRGGVFVFKVSADGSRLVYSRRLGGNGSYENAQDVGGPKGALALVGDIGNDIALDAVGHAYVTGTATSTGPPGFPTTPGALRASGALRDAAFNGFVAELTPNGSTLVFSTLLGGNRQG